MIKREATPHILLETYLQLNIDTDSYNLKKVSESRFALRSSIAFEKHEMSQFKRLIVTNLMAVSLSTLTIIGLTRNLINVNEVGVIILFFVKISST